jgi:hypothetical protein
MLWLDKITGRHWIREQKRGNNEPPPKKNSGFEEKLLIQENAQNTYLTY